MHVEDVMDTAVEAARADTPAERAWDRMRHRGIEVYALVDETGIVGLVTRQPLGGRDGSLNRRDRTLGDLACTRSVTTTPDSDIWHLVGVVTLAGLLTRLASARQRRQPRRGSALRAGEDAVDPPGRAGHRGPTVASP